MPVSDEDLEDQPRRDIERIWISSDEDDDAIVSQKGKQRRLSRESKPTFGLRPVRAARTLVEELEDAAKEKKSIKPDKIDDNNAIIDVDVDQMQVDEPAAVVKKDPPSSPELSKKLLKKVDTRMKDSKLLTETIEERAERLRMNEDIEKLREEFLHPQNKSDSDETIDSKEDTVFSRTDHDRMFLFQLPPLVPQLFNPADRVTTNGDTMNADGVDGVQVKAEPGTSSMTNDQDNTRNDPSNTKTEPSPSVFTASSVNSERLPHGFVGKLNIHKSGKITLDWGGTDMEVRYGTEVDFLQDVICVESAGVPDAAADEEATEKVGKAYAMGHVKGKMVLVPDWGKLYA